MNEWLDTRHDHSWEDPTFDTVAGDDGETDAAAARADALIARLATTPQEEALLNALAVGHHLASACRLANMTKGKAEYFLGRCSRDCA